MKFIVCVCVSPSSRRSVRPTSAHSSSPSSDSDDPDDSYVAMTTSSLSFSAGEPVKHSFLSFPHSLFSSLSFFPSILVIFALFSLPFLPSSCLLSCFLLYALLSFLPSLCSSVFLYCFLLIYA